MAYFPPNPNGQASSALSAPVVIAADQSAISVNEQHLLLLGRIIKALEGVSVIDSAQRIRFTLDNITAGLTLATVSTVAAVTTVTTVTTVSTVTSVTNVVSNAGMDREQYINIARQTYSTGIRAKLT